MAIENYLTLEDISLIIHGLPTLSEAVMDTAEIGMGLPIHFSYKKDVGKNTNIRNYRV
ncbi:hypothetical protein IGI80_001372 [Enterococcus sp. DIV1420a]